MQFKYRNIGRVEKGKLVYDNPRLIQNLIDGMEGQRFELYIRRERLPATKPQIAYLMAILKEIHGTERYGHYPSPKGILDKVFMPLFHGEYVIRDGKIKVSVRSLSDLNKDEVGQLIDKIKIYVETEDNIIVGEAKDYHL